MATIKTMTGSEWHSSYGAKGMVFVVKEGQEIPVYQAFVPEEQEWTDVQRGKHGKWCETEYEIPEGTILKLFAIQTWRNTPNGGGGAYFVVDSKAQEITAAGEGYGEHVGSLSGTLRHIPYEEAKKQSLINKKYAQYYKDGKISIQ